jgi:hypothetical protein
VTFSEVMPTNGFQPLWQAVVAVVVALCRFVGIDGAAGQLRAVLVTCWALLAAGLVLLDRLLRRGGVTRTPRAVAVAIGLVLLGGPYGTLATEASLVLVAVLGALLGAHRVLDAPTGPDAVRRSLAWGVVVGVVLLARLDTVFVVAALGAATAITVARRSGATAALRAVGPAVATATAVVVPYFAWNLASFGELMPISGAVKLDSGFIGFTPSAAGADALTFLALGAAAGAAAVVGRHPRPGATWDWATVLAGAALASGFYLVFSPGSLTDGSWYHVPQILALALGAALLADRVLLARPSLTPVALAGVGVVLVAAVGFVVVERVGGANDAQAEAVLDFSEGVRRLVPPDGVVATVDYPGYVALVGERPVVALDGLTGDFDFQESLVRDGAGCTLERLGVTHLVTISDTRLEPVAGASDGALSQVVTSWLDDVPVGELVVRPDDQLLDNATSGLTLWRVRPSCP